MTKSYVMLCDDSFWTLTEVAEWADGSPLVTHWRHDMLGCLYLISEAGVTALSKDFQRSAGRKGPFILVEVADQIAGVMLPETWSILYNKAPLGLQSAEAEVPNEGGKVAPPRGPMTNTIATEI